MANAKHPFPKAGWGEAWGLERVLPLSRPDNDAEWYNNVKARLIESCNINHLPTLTITLFGRAFQKRVITDE